MNRSAWNEISEIVVPLPKADVMFIPVTTPPAVTASVYFPER